jgi:anti-sigma B factor antagonist
MDVRERSVGPVTVLDPVGPLVLDETQDNTVLKETVGRLMREGHRLFMIDLSHVTHVDTSGLTSLVAAQVAVLKHGGHINLSSPTPRVRQLLSVTRLNKFFEIFGTEREAIEKLDTETRAGI